MAKTAQTLNAALPYAILLDSESDEGFRIAIEGLRLAVALGDVHRGVKFHMAALQRHLQLRHKLSDEQRGELIKIVFRLVVQDTPISMRVRMRWCNLLERLLQRGKHLKLSLPFRPLLNLVLRRSWPRLRKHEFTNRSSEHHYLQALARCASLCARHLATGSAAEIIAAIEPLLCAQDGSLVRRTAALSPAPTHAPHTLCSYRPSTQLRGATPRQASE